MNEKTLFILLILLIIIGLLLFYNYKANKLYLVYKNLTVKIVTSMFKDLQSKNQELKTFEESLNQLTKKHNDMEKALSTANYIGEFKITYYNICEVCTGKLDGITASGNIVKENCTIASDWDVLPPGTKVFIEGIGIRTVEDKGGAVKGNHIDVYLNKSDDEIKKLGVKTAKVYLIGGVN